MTTAVKPTYTQTLYLVSWSQPDKEGCIDFFDDDNEGRVWETLEDAEASLAQEGPSGCVGIDALLSVDTPVLGCG